MAERRAGGGCFGATDGRRRWRRVRRRAQRAHVYVTLTRAALRHREWNRIASNPLAEGSSSWSVHSIPGREDLPPTSMAPTNDNAEADSLARPSHLVFDLPPLWEPCGPTPSKRPLELPINPSPLVAGHLPSDFRTPSPFVRSREVLEIRRSKNGSGHRGSIHRRLGQPPDFSGGFGQNRGSFTTATPRSFRRSP